MVGICWDDLCFISRKKHQCLKKKINIKKNTLSCILQEKEIKEIFDSLGRTVTITIVPSMIYEHIVKRYMAFITLHLYSLAADIILMSVERIYMLHVSLFGT